MLPGALTGSLRATEGFPISGACSLHCIGLGLGLSLGLGFVASAHFVYPGRMTECKHGDEQPRKQVENGKSLVKRRLWVEQKFSDIHGVHPLYSRAN